MKVKKKGEWGHGHSKPRKTEPTGDEDTEQPPVFDGTVVTVISGLIVIAILIVQFFKGC